MLSNEHKEKLYPLFRSHSLEDVRQAISLLEPHIRPIGPVTEQIRTRHSRRH